MLRSFYRDENGQGMVEYILIIALIAIAVIAAVRTFGGKISGLFKSFGEKIENEGTQSLTSR
jgi:pilus assembly protein Flp/PilA